MNNKISIFQDKTIEEISTRLAWVIRARWVGLTIMAVGLVIFYSAFNNLSRPRLLMELLLIEAGFNFFYFLVWRANLKRPLLLSGLSLLSIVLDAFFIAYFLYAARIIGHFSGLIFAVPIIMGGIIFPMNVSLLNTLLVSGIYYYFLQLSQAALVISPGVVFQETGTIVFFFLISFFVGYLSDETRHRHHRLWQLQAEIIDKNNQIYRTQQEIIRTEKMATVTELAIGLDEEINAPITVILGIWYFLKNHFSKKLVLSIPEVQELKDSLKIIIDQVKKIRDTMKNLEHLKQKSAE